MNTLLHGDSREVLKTLAECSADSIVTDPPYHLVAGRKGGSGLASVNDTPYSLAGKRGFMGMTWDGGEVAHDPALWAECLRVAKPGAWLVAFGGTRTFHRLAVAIEDAGWELRDSPLRGHVHQPEDCPWLAGWMFGSGFPKSHNGEWGGTALKPAWEPIVLARKPLIGTVEANWREHGTGALNIDGCRIEVGEGDVLVEFDRAPGNVSRENWRKGTCVGAGKPVERGRWPANLIHDGSNEVVALFPREAGAAAPVTVRNGDKFRGTYGAFAGNIDEKGSTIQGDTGSAARFFYCAKASVEDREEGLQHIARKALAYGNQAQAEVKRGNTEHAGDSGMNTVKMRGNHHPTVKPTDLMRWLVRLVTPPGGLVLDPFMGSGSTGKAAMLEGMRFTGIDLSAEYIEIARARIEFARRQGHQPELMEA